MASPRSTLPSTSSSPRKAKQDPISSTRMLQQQTQIIQKKFVKGSPEYKLPPPAVSFGPINDVTSTTDNEDTMHISSRYNSRQADFLTLPLDSLSKEDIKESLKNSKVPLKYGLSDDEDETKEEEEEYQLSTVIGPDRARFNMWKGTNYDLHVLGNFKSDFDKKVKSFQRPDTMWIRMDPFFRSDTGIQDEPGNSEAFLLWKTTSTNWESDENKSEIKQTQSITNTVPYDTEDDTSSDDDIESSSSTTSLPNVDIKSYVRSQKKKRKEGLDVTGENIYYDDEFDVIRNLHRDSYSLTTYGTLPDEKFFGKAYIFYPEMTTDEKKMLQPIERKDTLSKKKSSKTITSPRPAIGNDIKLNHLKRNDSGDYLSSSPINH